VRARARARASDVRVCAPAFNACDRR
jgi:hypothetical protein